jgi:hypothetical protein
LAIQMVDVVKHPSLQAFDILVGQVLKRLPLVCLVSPSAVAARLTNQRDPPLVAGPPCLVIPMGHRLAEELKRQRFHRQVPRLGLRSELGH